MMKSYFLLIALGAMISLPAQAESAQPANTVHKSQVEKKFLNAFWNDAVVSQAVVVAFFDEILTHAQGQRDAENADAALNLILVPTTQLSSASQI